MFGLASGVYQNYFAPPKLSILIVGLDGSGKTALLERIKVTNISTQLDVSSQLPPTYSEGAVVLGSRKLVAASNNGRVANNNGRKALPARLPPPLPSKKAARSRKFVDKTVASSSSATQNNDGDEFEIKINEVARQFLISDVPPPPFDMSAETTYTPKKNNNTNNEVTSNNENLRGSLLMNMLRCPSPQKYTAAARGDDDDEYIDEHHDGPISATVSSQSGDDDEEDEVWDEEYLNGYHIDYIESQQFDIKNAKVKMFPLDKIRPTLGQNLAKLDMCGCKCSLFDLSGAEKMRPLWERYYRDADAIVYVVNCADTSFDNLEKSRSEFKELCQNDVIQRRCRAGLPILIFANQIDLAYREYGDATNGNNGGIREHSWHADEEDNFVGGGNNDATASEESAKRTLDFHDLATLFGLGNNENDNNIFLFGGSAKSGEGVRASMEVLLAQAKKYHLERQAERR